jgi:hypothetical protein
VPGWCKSGYPRYEMQTFDKLERFYAKLVRERAHCKCENLTTRALLTSPEKKASSLVRPARFL